MGWGSPVPPRPPRRQPIARLLAWRRAAPSASRTFDGESVAGNSLLIRYTAAGDANLDGVVDTSDFTPLATNFGGSGKRWYEGDFNYDGVVNALDFNMLASNFGFAVPAPSLGTIVPEPGIGMVLAGFGFLIRRRRAFPSPGFQPNGIKP